MLRSSSPRLRSCPLLFVPPSFDCHLKDKHFGLGVVGVAHRLWRGVSSRLSCLSSLFLCSSHRLPADVVPLADSDTIVALSFMLLLMKWQNETGWGGCSRSFAACWLVVRVAARTVDGCIEWVGFR